MKRANKRSPLLRAGRVAMVPGGLFTFWETVSNHSDGGKFSDNDCIGTSAADRSDYLETHISQLTEIIVNSFEIPVEADDYKYVGVYIYGTEVEDVCATFFFRNKETKEVSWYFKSLVAMQSILNLFKRFEFQIEDPLEDIDRDEVREIE